jgi:hypothetical protein
MGIKSCRLKISIKKRIREKQITIIKKNKDQSWYKKSNFKG